MIKTIMAAILAALFFSGCAKKPTPHLPTVESLDLKRYVGKWTEIARYENWFEKGCVGATADYAMQNDYVRVTNSCYDANGVKTAEANGRAYILEES